MPRFTSWVSSSPVGQHTVSFTLGDGKRAKRKTVKEKVTACVQQQHAPLLQLGFIETAMHRLGICIVYQTSGIANNYG